MSRGSCPVCMNLPFQLQMFLGTGFESLVGVLVLLAAIDRMGGKEGVGVVQ